MRDIRPMTPFLARDGGSSRTGCGMSLQMPECLVIEVDRFLAGPLPENLPNTHMP